MRTTTPTPATPRPSSAELTGVWSLDPERTTVALATRTMWGLLPVTGSFRATGGGLTVGPDGQVSGHVEIDAASITTGIKLRDKHLRGEDFLATTRFPHIVVRIERLDVTPQSLTAVGTLHAKGASVPVRFPVSVTAVTPGILDVEGALSVDRAAVGIDIAANGATTMENQLTVRVRLHRSA